MMRQNPRFFRLTATVAIGALLCNAVLPRAFAQPAPSPPATSATAPDQPQSDPPARVGRIASQSGAVSFRTSADTQWSAATPNYPVSAGNAFWTEPTARAELQISASRVDLSGQTEFDVATLADSGLQATLPRGEIYLHLISLGPDEVWSVQTPRGTVRLTVAGRYGIAAGTTEQPTLVTVLDGAAEIEGPGVALHVAANQTATLTGSDPFQGAAGPAQRDAFLAARVAAEHPAPAPVASIPPQVAHMPGGQDLYTYGEWSQAPDYGEVWYPPVDQSWVPYRDGQWSYVAPWGWTWVDRAPWGFAPFHYGRWAHIGSRWGWIPGEGRAAERPVYAPALVAFIGAAAGVAVGAALARRSVGWVPLGPREAYHPWYHASTAYVGRINTGHARDAAPTAGDVRTNNFTNRMAATSVPASVMLGSRQVRTAARPMSAQAFAAAQPEIGQQPIRPSAATLGVTPAVARQLNLQPAGREGPSRRPAPGPLVRVQEPGPANGPPPRPVLIGPRGEPAGAPRPGEPAGAPRPGEPAGVPRPGEPAAGPGAAHAPGGALPLVVPGTGQAGPPRAGETRPPAGPPASVMPPGRPEGVNRPGSGPEIGRPGGPPVLPAPSTRPAGVPEPREARPPGEPPTTPRLPEGRPAGNGAPTPGPEPTNHPAAIEHPPSGPLPAGPTPGPHGPPPGGAPEPPRFTPPPRVTGPEPPRAVAPEPPRPPPPAPHIVAPEPPHPAPPPPPPHVAPPPPPPPHAAPPPPPPPHAAPPPPPPPPPHAGPPPQQKKPGER